jgi:hypothetical protein
VPTTPRLGLPYPALSDIPSGPVAVGNLANSLDALGVLGGKYRVTNSGVINTVESVVIDSQTLALTASSIFLIQMFVSFTTTVAGSDVDAKIRMTSVSGTLLAERSILGVYATPEPNSGSLSVIYQTGVTAELDYFCGTIIRTGTGTGTVTVIPPTYLLVSNLGPAALVGQV